MSRKRHTEVSWDSDDDLLRDDASAISAFPKSEIRVDSDDELDEELLLGSDDEHATKKSSSKKSSSASSKSSLKASSKSAPTKNKSVSLKSSTKSVSDTSVPNNKQKEEEKTTGSKSLTSVSTPVVETKKTFKFTKIVPPSPDNDKEKPSKSKTGSKFQSSVQQEPIKEQLSPLHETAVKPQPVRHSSPKESVTKTRSHREQPQKHKASQESVSKHELSPPQKPIRKEPIPVVEITSRSDFEDEEQEEIVLDILDPAADQDLFEETDPLLHSSQDSLLESDAAEEEEMEEEEEEEMEEEEGEETQDITEEDTALENSQMEAAEDEQESESDSESDESESGRGRFKSERAKIVTTTTVKAKPRDIDAIPDTLEISEEQQAQIDEFLVSGGKRGRGRGRGRGNSGRGHMGQSGRFPPYQGQGQNFGQQQSQQYQGQMYNQPPNYPPQVQGHMLPHMGQGQGYQNQSQMHPGHMQSHLSHVPPSQSHPNVVPSSRSSYGPSKMSIDVSESLQGHTRPVPLTSKSSVPTLFTLAGLDKPKAVQPQPRKILINPHFRGPAQPQQDRPPASVATSMPHPGPQMPGPYQGPTSRPQNHQHPQDRVWPPHSQPSAGPPYPVHDTPPRSQPMGGFPQPAPGFPADSSVRDESVGNTGIGDHVEDNGGPRPQQGFPQNNGPPNMFPGGPSGPRGAQPALNHPQMGMLPPGHPQHRPQGPFPGPMDMARYGTPHQQQHQHRFQSPASMNQFNNPPRQLQPGPGGHGIPAHPHQHPRGTQFPPHMNQSQRPPHQGGPRPQFHPNQQGSHGNQANRGTQGNQQRFQPPAPPNQMMPMHNHPNQQPRHPMQHQPRQQQPRQQQPRQQQPCQQQPRQQQPRQQQPRMQNTNRQNQFQPRQQFSGNKRNFNRNAQEDSQEIQSIQVISRGKRQSVDKDKGEHSPAKIAKSEEIVDPVLKAKLEEQKRKRDHIIRLKEARRQALAGERRSQLERKLAEEGKTIADVEKGVAPIPSAKTNMPGKAIWQNSAGQQGQGHNQGQHFQPRTPNTGQPRFGPRQPQQLGGPGQGGPKQQFPANRPSGPRGGPRPDTRPPGPGNINRPNTNVQRQNSQQGNQNRQVNMPSQNTTQGNTNQNANTGKDGNLVLKQRVTILNKDSHGKVISRTVMLKNINKTGGQDDRQVTLSGSNSQRTVISKPAGPGQRKVVQNQEGRRVVVGESPPLSKVVSIDNLSVSTTEANIKKMCFGIGEVESVQMLKGQKKATVTFQDANSAAQFSKKFNRHMLDLSHINVTHLPI
ncbi:RNA-binding protein 33-like isoform X2 [Mizuhopecten yessoensis]|uniref:RNA-binding protein 33-like isoform X2 n=1 Tax=Mizuhopecten yessoensis TaxID=6573 RepID=UPI000B45A629|nr:RNA-binding protein 33-like isoform X2 [Mizuhopecten yessoensis]